MYAACQNKLSFLLQWRQMEVKGEATEQRSTRYKHPPIYLETSLGSPEETIEEPHLRAHPAILVSESFP